MYICIVCGHTLEEHADTFIQACEVEGCECELPDWEEAESGDA